MVSVGEIIPGVLYVATEHHAAEYALLQEVRDLVLLVA